MIRSSGDSLLAVITQNGREAVEMLAQNDYQSSPR